MHILDKQDFTFRMPTSVQQDLFFFFSHWKAEKRNVNLKLTGLAFLVVCLPPRSMFVSFPSMGCVSPMLSYCLLFMYSSRSVNSYNQYLMKPYNREEHMLQNELDREERRNLLEFSFFFISQWTLVQYDHDIHRSKGPKLRIQTVWRIALFNLFCFSFLL